MRQPDQQAGPRRIPPVLVRFQAIVQIDTERGPPMLSVGGQHCGVEQLADRDMRLGILGHPKDAAFGAKPQSEGLDPELPLWGHPQIVGSVVTSRAADHNQPEPSCRNCSAKVSASGTWVSST